MDIQQIAKSLALHSETPEKAAASVAAWIAYAKGELSAYHKENERLRQALRDVRNVVGPQPCSCGCEGLQVEVAEALKIIEKALTNA